MKFLRTLLLILFSLPSSRREREKNLMYGSITLGYLFSNLDIFGISRNLHYDGVRFGDFYPDRKLMHGAFISLSFNI